MSNHTFPATLIDKPDVTVQHYFTPAFIIHTGNTGQDPVLDDIDFFDCQHDSLTRHDGEFVNDLDISRIKASEFLDGLFPAMIEACKAIAEGKTLVALDAKPIETDRADGSDCEGVLVWFGEDDSAAATKFRSDVDKVIYG